MSDLVLYNNNLPASFLGTGWSFPPRFDKDQGTVSLVSDEDSILDCLKAILYTRLNERPARLDFGCNLRPFLFQELDYSLVNQIRNTVSTALAKYEPRIIVEEVLIDSDDAEDGKLLITIYYKVRVTNNSFNFVYPFYLNEGSIANL